MALAELHRAGRAAQPARSAMGMVDEKSVSRRRDGRLAVVRHGLDAVLSGQALAHRGRVPRGRTDRHRRAHDGVEPVGNSPDEFANYLRADIARWARVAQSTGIRVD